MVGSAHPTKNDTPSPPVALHEPKRLLIRDQHSCPNYLQNNVLNSFPRKTVGTSEEASVVVLSEECPKNLKTGACACWVS